MQHRVAVSVVRLDSLLPAPDDRGHLQALENLLTPHERAVAVAVLPVAAGSVEQVGVDLEPVSPATSASLREPSASPECPGPTSLSTPASGSRRLRAATPQRSPWAESATRWPS
ncbi:hypothetical protein [Subtercola boreus]|uniref:hypothetical protein n=1 Tax=Subtercola boreus TaxID=120213 RepID=UPI0011C07E08|nr:hypothetical protein [Subtercola boreus]